MTAYYRASIVLVSCCVWLLASSLPAYSKLAPPYHLSASQRTTRSVKLTWDKATTTTVKYYKIKITSHGNILYTANTTDTSAMIHRLAPHTIYTAQVKTVNVTGRASAYSTIQFTSKPSSLTGTQPRLIDMLAHVNIKTTEPALTDLQTVLTDWNISMMNLMPVPNALKDAANGYSESRLLNFIGEHNIQFRTVYGGNTLNPILHALGGTANLALADIYPNGLDNEAELSGLLADTQAIATDATTWTATFQQQATEAAQSGDYIGFGELSPVHYFSSR
ncbi:MAG: fibronectin type III domain-containing protein [Candidatus Kerfeldbacteria bacterium]|nr:fibronectin type III domain-containing protein [Candidatus Kerfeldbacteria bacterium]